MPPKVMAEFCSKKDRHLDSELEQSRTPMAGATPAPGPTPGPPRGAEGGVAPARIRVVPWISRAAQNAARASLSGDQTRHC